jgi:hypothetical protein
VSCEGVLRCTTERRKTHKTLWARVLYAWHPFYGHEVAVHGERNRRGTIVFTCRVGREENGAVLEIPAWMFDEAVCCHFQSAPEAAVTVEALRALGRMLQAASGVLEAQHESTACGESDTQTKDYSNEATHAFSNPDSGRSTAGDRREDCCSLGPASSSAHGSKGGGEQTSGVRS